MSPIPKSRTEPVDARPLRELIDPVVDRTVPAARTINDRRSALRFRCDLPGTLHIRGTEHPVVCSDLGYSGMCVVSGMEIQPTPGDRVTVDVQHERVLYREDFTIVACKPAAQGTTLHLSL